MDGHYKGQCANSKLDQHLRAEGGLRLMALKREDVNMYRSTLTKGIVGGRIPPLPYIE